MKVLLDTHSFLRFALNDPRLSAMASRTISDSENDVLMSPASYWEIAIKISIGKYELSMPYKDLWQEAFRQNSIQVLPIELRHTEILVSLPFHHKDPFDRLIVAQALADNIPLISADAALDAYGIDRLW